MSDYRSLRVWSRSHELVLSVCALTDGFPDKERFELASQMRRSAMSIPTNLAEGSGRRSDREKSRYCEIALGSANELDYQLFLARDLGYLPSALYADMAEELDHIRRMLARLITRLSGTSGGAGTGTARKLAH